MRLTKTQAQAIDRAGASVATMLYVVMAIMLAFSVGQLRAEGARSERSSPDRTCYVNDSSVNSSGDTAEAVDFSAANLTNWGATTAVFSCMFDFDADFLLLTKAANESISASNIATPATNGTPSNVVYMESDRSPITLPLDAKGWIWQSVVAGSEANVKATCNY